MRKILFIWAVLWSLVGQAQNDTYFVLPPLYEWEAGQHNIQLNISTSAASSTVWIYNSDTSYSSTLTVTSGNVTSVTFSSIISALQSTYGARELNWDFSIREKDALFIETTEPVIVAEHIVHQYNQEMVTAKGMNALGTDFYLASQTLIETTVSGPNQGYEGMHYVSIVATENNTVVDLIAPSGEEFGNGSDSIRVTMQQGQSYVATMEDDGVLLGGRVRSNKPIAVVAGGNHLKNSNGNNADAGIDQITPVDFLGTKYVVLRGMDFYPQDYFMYIAVEDNTDISVNGTSIASNVSQGSTGTYSMIGSASQPGTPFIIESTKPIYVFQVTTGSTNNVPEQGMAQLPHVDCTGSYYIRYNKPSNLSTSALITIPSSAVPQLMYNGSAISNYMNITTQQSAYDPNWTGVFIPAGTLTSNFALSCTSPFHCGILSGNSGTGLYGYISGFDDDFKLLDPVYAQPVEDVPLGSLCATPIPLYFGFITCVDSIRVLSRTLLKGTGSVVDSNDRDTIMHALIDPQYTGPVRIKVVVEDDRGFKDSIYYDFDYYGTTYDPVLADTVQVCTGSPTTISVENPGPTLTYLWSTGDTTASIDVEDPGELWVIVDVGLCFFTDTITLIDGSLVIPLPDTSYCDSVFVDFNQPNLQSIYWITLDTTANSLWLDSTATYPYIATDINGCTSRDSLHFRVIPEPFVDEGFNCPDFTLTATGYTAFIAMEVGGNRYLQPQIDTTFTFAGTHELLLVAIDSCGNLDTIRSVLEVDCLDDINLYVPNAFTPNGDGKNDSFCISSSIPERTSYKVFDRWGNELFSGLSNECWDPAELGQNISTGTYNVRTFTKLLSGRLHIHHYTIFALP